VAGVAGVAGRADLSSLVPPVGLFPGVAGVAGVAGRAEGDLSLDSDDDFVAGLVVAGRASGDLSLDSEEGLLAGVEGLEEGLADSPDWLEGLVAGVAEGLGVFSLDWVEGRAAGVAGVAGVAAGLDFLSTFSSVFVDSVFVAGVSVEVLVLLD
jgi:hypothetical protein